MAKEQTFKSPGFFDREIDLTQKVQAPFGVPAGIIGTAEKGPAFVPITVGSFPDFRTKFGGLDSKRFGPYAVNEFLKHKTALTYLRVLGAGANDTVTDIESTRVKGTVRNAGFVVLPQAATFNATGSRDTGGVVFIAARHTVQSGQAIGYPIFLDNDSFGSSDVHVIRAMVMVASGTRLMVMDGASNIQTGFQNNDDEATLGSTGAMSGKFKLLISSSAPGYATTDGLQGLRVLTASLDPTSNDYIAKVLNTNPDDFSTEEHYLYADFAIENELASISTSPGAIMLASGSGLESSTSGDPTLSFSSLFGRFDTRYTTPSTTQFISQPFGSKEFDLFRFETLSDGMWGNDRIKVSIVAVQKSTNPAYEYGSFAVQVRSFDDNDLDPQVIEQFPNVNLDPTSDRYIGQVIGDTRTSYAFDADQPEERRLITHGRFPNRSAFIRVVISPAVDRARVPATVLPFGFRGPQVINTSDALGDVNGTVTSGIAARRLTAYSTGTAAFNVPSLTGSIVPPLPMTFKATRGAVAQSPGFVGQPGVTELADARIYWGVKTTRIAPTGSLTDAILNPNVSSVTNPLVSSLVRFQGIPQLDALVTGSATDAFNNNKFSMSRVALSNASITDITGTAAQHMLETAYIRNARPSSVDYTVIDPLTGAKRVTLASLANLTSSVEFNRFTSFTKFTNLFYGGFDGTNILDPDASRLNDLAASSDEGGGANVSTLSPGLSTNVAGFGQLNNATFSYIAASNIMTDELASNINILAIPGIRDSFVTDAAAKSCRDNGLIFFVQDIVKYDEDLDRLFDGSTSRADVRRTAEQFDGRALDNNYAAAYFPDVVIDDLDNNRRVQVPSTVAVMGAIAFNDRVGQPWFAPAGFNRGALDFVSNVDVRLYQDDKDRLAQSHINPIAHFPKQGTTPFFVIFGQETLQAASSALDRVNVRRMLLEVKRQVVTITREGFVFEQNTATTRLRWVAQVTPRLAAVQVQAGIEAFRIIMDDSNNTDDDVQNNRLNGKIILVPTRTVENIAIDFIITNAGVSFVE